MLDPARCPVGKRVTLFFSAWLLCGASLVSNPQELVLSASCGLGCDPKPSSFTVPAGHKAAQFRIRSLTSGEPCSGGKREPLAGFSIRRGGDTVVVYYRDSGGVVSDPVPLENLTLEPGPYLLLSVPAKGATVTLACTLSPAQRVDG